MTYALNVPVTAQEADLCNVPSPPFIDPVPVLYGEAVLAVVQLTASGLAANAAYVVMQTDMGDGVWVDVAWVSWAGTSGTAVFVLSGGVAGRTPSRTLAAGGDGVGGERVEPDAAGGAGAVRGQGGDDRRSSSPGPGGARAGGDGDGSGTSCWGCDKCLSTSSASA